MVEIDKDRLEELLFAEAFLEQLDNLGVDNWEGYDMVDREDVDKQVVLQMVALT